MTPLKATGPQTFCGKSHILRDVGVTVNEGEIVTLLGRNGAGKTTTLRSIMSLTPPHQGIAANETVQAACLGNPA
jgi:branched-chain amino acid transport system ATP-binding protein